MRAGARDAGGDGRASTRTSRPGVDFALRVGINTGEVLAGAVGESYTVTGDTVNVAVAPPERGPARAA